MTRKRGSRMGRRFLISSVIQMQVSRITPAITRAPFKIHERLRDGASGACRCYAAVLERAFGQLRVLRPFFNSPAHNKLSFERNSSKNSAIAAQSITRHPRKAKQTGRPNQPFVRVHLHSEYGLEQRKGRRNSFQRPLAHLSPQWTIFATFFRAPL